MLSRGLAGLAFKIRALNEASKKNGKDRLILLRGDDFVLVQQSDGKVLKKLGSLKERGGKPIVEFSSEDLNLNGAQAKGVFVQITKSGEYGVSFEVAKERVLKIESFRTRLDESGSFEQIEGVDSNGRLAVFIHLKALSEAAMRGSSAQKLKTGTN